MRALKASGAYRGTREKPTFRRGKRPCRLTDSHNENLEQGNNYQEGEVICLKASDKLAVATQPRLLILPKGNERCQGRNGRTYCAHVGAKAMPAQSFEKWLIRIALGTLLIIWLLTSEVTNAPQASKTVLKKSEMAGI